MMKEKLDEAQIMGKYCSDCKFCKIEERSKSKVLVHCSKKGKTYMYGQCIPCAEKEKRKHK